MKIEQGNIHITDIPVFESIEVSREEIILTLDDGTTRFVSGETLTALRDALTAALDAHDHMTGSPITSTEPRVFNANDAQPPIGTQVKDIDGDVWHRGPNGWGIGHKGGADSWAHVLRYAPLTEVR